MKLKKDITKIDYIFQICISLINLYFKNKKEIYNFGLLIAFACYLFTYFIYAFIQLKIEYYLEKFNDNSVCLMVCEKKAYFLFIADYYYDFYLKYL